jgi:hypothetical protein
MLAHRETMPVMHICTRSASLHTFMEECHK